MVPEMALFLNRLHHDGFELQADHPIAERVDFHQQEVFVF
jgi:hypothetical protein